MDFTKVLLKVYNETTSRCKNKHIYKKINGKKCPECKKNNNRNKKRTY